MRGARLRSEMHRRPGREGRPPPRALFSFTSSCRGAGFPVVSGCEAPGILRRRVKWKRKGPFLLSLFF